MVENRSVLTLEDFDKKLAETDAYLQLLIDQVQVRVFIDFPRSIKIWNFVREELYCPLIYKFDCQMTCLRCSVHPRENSSK